MQSIATVTPIGFSCGTKLKIQDEKTAHAPEALRRFV